MLWFVFILRVPLVINAAVRWLASAVIPAVKECILLCGHQTWQEPTARHSLRESWNELLVAVLLLQLFVSADICLTQLPCEGSGVV